MVSQEASFQIMGKTVDQAKAQSPAKAHREVNLALKNGPASTIIAGVIGETKPPEPTKPPLTDDEINLKTKLTELLKAVITPPELSAKSNPERDKRAMFHKLDSCDIPVLLMLVPEKYRGKEPKMLGPSDIAELERIYKDISP